LNKKKCSLWGKFLPEVQKNWRERKEMKKKMYKSIRELKRWKEFAEKGLGKGGIEEEHETL
jgi:hypothetical protein